MEKSSQGNTYLNEFKMTVEEIKRYILGIN